MKNYKKDLQMEQKAHAETLKKLESALSEVSDLKGVEDLSSIVEHLKKENTSLKEEIKTLTNKYEGSLEDLKVSEVKLRESTKAKASREGDLETLCKKLEKKVKQLESRQSKIVPKESYDSLYKKYEKLLAKDGNSVSKEKYETLEDKYWELMSKTPTVKYVRGGDGS